MSGDQSDTAASPEPPLASNSRTLWRRYRGLVALSLALGAVVGFVMVLIIGGGASLFGLTISLGVSFGASTALIACIGGFGALAIRGRKQELDSGSRVRIGAGGAGLSVLVSWLVIAVLAALFSNSFALFGFFLPIAVITSVVTWVIASIGLQRVEQQHGEA